MPFGMAEHNTTIGIKRLYCPILFIAALAKYYIDFPDEWAKVVQLLLITKLYTTDKVPEEISFALEDQKTVVTRVKRHGHAAFSHPQNGEWHKLLRVLVESHKLGEKLDKFNQTHQTKLVRVLVSVPPVPPAT